MKLNLGITFSVDAAHEITAALPLTRVLLVSRGTRCPGEGWPAAPVAALDRA
jgi:hypothetical protein